MKPLSSDTPLEVEKVWLAMQRQRGPLWRLRRAVEMTTFCWRAGQEAVRRAHPDASTCEQDRILLTQRYGAELADGFIRRRQEIGFYD